MMSSRRDVVKIATQTSLMDSSRRLVPSIRLEWPNLSNLEPLKTRKRITWHLRRKKSLLRISNTIVIKSKINSKTIGSNVKRTPNRTRHKHPREIYLIFSRASRL